MYFLIFLICLGVSLTEAYQELTYYDRITAKKIHCLRHFG